MNTQAAPTTEPQKTTVGSYFVSNYPPFSVWSKDNAHEALAAIEQAPHPETPLGMYIHIPFCRKRCHFCYFRVYTDKNAQEVRTYINAVNAEMELYKDKPFLGGRKPQFVYFGGGTPSFLSPKQLHELVDGLSDTLSWDQSQEVTFECEPGTLNENKLRAIRDIGVTRLSLGVENFDDNILEINNRAHRTGEIRKAYDYARSIDFPQINIDLIAGMIGETDENWRRCVEETIAYDPDCVTIYQMEIPYNTTIYKDMMKEKGMEIAPVADWETKRRWVKEAFERLGEAGYSINSAYTAVKNPKTTKFVYRDSLWFGADLMSLGVASFGHIGDVHLQNEKDYGPYVESVNEGKLPIRRALRLTDEERLVREFILQHKLGKVQRSYFIEKFNVDILERFKPQLDIHQSNGYLEKSKDCITLTQDGLLRVDELLHDYFLPQHRDVRYT